MAAPTVRRAMPGDLDGVRRVALASDLGPHDSGADPRYVAHLMRHGELTVVLGGDGAVAGYAGTIAVGERRFVTDLFVLPGARDRGLGGALLAGALAGHDRPMTFSSKDPRAVGLYRRTGLAVSWALLYLRGDPGRLSPPTVRWAAGAVGGPEAAAAERSFGGADRRAEYGYWTSRPDGRAVAVTCDGRIAAVGAVGGAGDEYGVAHLACAPDADAAAAVPAVLAGLTGRPRICLPDAHPAVPALLAAGFAVEDFDLFMTAERDPAPPRGAFHPGLY